MRIELWAAPDIAISPNPPVEAEGLSDLEAAIRALEALSDEEAEEAMAQVHEQFEYIICPACRKSIRQGLSGRASGSGPLPEVS